MANRWDLDVGDDNADHEAQTLRCTILATQAENITTTIK